jgi:predicted amidohydrolase
MMDPWFPDFVARWYDAFRDGFPHEGKLDEWSQRGVLEINTFLEKLRRAPHETAVQIDKYVEEADSAERRFHALRMASAAIRDMGFREVKISGGAEWAGLRRHWTKYGNLLRDMTGHLVPRETLKHRWWWMPGRRRHTEDSYFEGFGRWQVSDSPNLGVLVRVMPLSSIPETKRLRIGVVPLVEAVADFDVKPDNSRPDWLRYSMTLKRSSRKRILAAALAALQKSSEAACDIVIFPELCLTPKMQKDLSEALRKTGAERPWLVVAGSARTPVEGRKGQHHNRALVFDMLGKQVLSHHKLHRYILEGDQQERYGLTEALGYTGRFEDMETDPIEIEVLDTPAGRFAVLICEDLTAPNFVSALADKLCIDWLLVPVLDGTQEKSRWPTRFGKKYAEAGVAVVVATSLSLVREHLSKLPSRKSLGGVGVALVPTAGAPKVRILRADVHDVAVTWDV